MKTYALEHICSVERAKVALTSALPGQSSPRLLRAADNDVIAYFNVVESDLELKCPAVTADISGRHYNEDRAVLAVLTLLKRSVAGEINAYP